MADWAADAAAYGTQPTPTTSTMNGSGAAGGGAVDEIANRTAHVSAQLKKLYRKSVLPVEKRYKYDYFYESPLLSDVEFDGETFKNSEMVSFFRSFFY